METSRHEASHERTRAILAITPETFVRNWQLTGLKVLRAQERMLHGMMSAARLEMQFGQDLLTNRMARFNSRHENGARADGAFQEFDRMITMMREVTEELRNGFTEATQLLTETAEESLRDAQKAVQTVADKSAEAAHDSLQSSGKFTKMIVEATENAGTEKEAARRHV